MSHEIKFERVGAVAWLRFNRPEKRNAITWEMYESLIAALETSGSDPATRVVCLAGEAGNFTSGSDVKGLQAKPAKGVTRPGQRFLQMLASFEKPLIAVVNGYAIGVGATLLLHADLVYAATGSTFRFPFVSLGLVPEGASTLGLPRLAGCQRASELLLLAEPFGVETALDIGLVNKALPVDELEAYATSKAQALAAMPPAAVRDTKALIRRDSAALLERMRQEFEVLERRLESEEFAEAVAAFQHKRNADFSRFE